MRLRPCLRWVLLQPSGEPQGLYRLFVIGVLLVLVGSVSSVSVGILQGLWAFQDDPRFELWTCCVAQRESFERTRQLLNEHLLVSRQRTAGLGRVLTDPHSPAFADARRALGVEEELQHSIRQKLTGASVESVRHFMFFLVPALLGLVTLSLVTARAAAHHGLVVVGAWSRDGTANDWRWPYWSCTALVFLTHTFREVWTSILSTDKSWLAWSSFCVSTLAWLLMLVTALGMSLVLAYPATILWQFGKAGNWPSALDPTHRDGQWGAGSYILFIQTWAVLSLVLTLFPATLWLRASRDNPRLSAPYLLATAVFMALACVVSARLFAAGIAVRIRYRTELERLGSTWATIQRHNPPPDPTVAFLGDSWWKLPATIFGTLSALWLLVGALGISDFLLRLVTGVR